MLPSPYSGFHITIAIAIQFKLLVNEVASQLQRNLNLEVLGIATGIPYIQQHNMIIISVIQLAIMYIVIAALMFMLYVYGYKYIYSQLYMQPIAQKQVLNYRVASQLALYLEPYGTEEKVQYQLYIQLYSMQLNQYRIPRYKIRRFCQVNGHGSTPYCYISMR